MKSGQGFGSYLTMLKTVTMTTEKDLVQNIDGVKAVLWVQRKRIVP